MLRQSVVFAQLMAAIPSCRRLVIKTYTLPSCDTLDVFREIKVAMASMNVASKFAFAAYIGGEEVRLI